MAMKQLDAAAVESELARLDGWSLDGAKLHKTYTFPDFVEAFAFMTRVAVLAEEQDHHPEWRNVYRTVEVHLTTHDAGGISERDFRLARSMDLAVAT
ncbi:MAG: 4a-hydroxytetrahydrobiopterin dehydratase [Planctomycetota bacterium]|jgi:4a-hydroxytetrahydrobiopterin dehydratase